VPGGNHYADADTAPDHYTGSGNDTYADGNSDTGRIAYASQPPATPQPPQWQ